MDPMCPALPPRQPLLVVAGPTAEATVPRPLPPDPEPRVLQVSSEDRDLLAREIGDRRPGQILLISPGTGDGGTPLSLEALLGRPGASAERPAALPVVRRRSAAEVMMLLAALGLSSGQSAREDD
jgi:hypothetical protein